MIKKIATCLFTAVLLSHPGKTLMAQQKPNIIFIIADDLGYGDLGCYGATKIKTPHIDQLAKQGLRYTNGHTTSATCTPSRYALLTGQYPWRKNGTGILPGDAALIIPPGSTTVPSLLKKAGYQTAVVGKWHLGLGEAVEKNWNGEVKPSPNETGFDYSFIFPATADRVPTVFLENHHVVALDSSDPIAVNYKQMVGNEPTGKDHPELLKLKASPGQGHNQTIVNGIGRIGYMTGGKTARWVDEEVSTTFLAKAKSYIQDHHKKPFFLYFALTEPHVPRMPATMFKGKSGLGLRGDAILQLDWTVGQIMQQLKDLGIEKNTIVIFTSDNGPVLDDGYADEAVTKLNGHTPAGPLRGGKYSAFEAGTRVPWIMSWPGAIKPGVTDALLCQVDLLASFAKLTKQTLANADAPDSYDTWDAFTGKTKTGRSTLVQQGGAISIVNGHWKYIEPSKGAKILGGVNIESGSDEEPQLYDLSNDIGEKNNLANTHPDRVIALKTLLQQIRDAGRSRK
ncbi:arylsulfatase [Paraflavitalea sp. CAU 1676]|uniref:sulfatase family protein n=1 Tax=Paraflavitalea sp. CAU 1676 TaxID=3032598 RepID=UPI0023DCD34A|nr:arylsulfatase [Paraflavitalea sp. CAU 1676]MDF2189059.1 arylsulfatase [Paraflavitalea sp. CAU 1676]